MNDNKIGNQQPEKSTFWIIAILFISTFLGMQISQIVTAVVGTFAFGPRVILLLAFNDFVSVFVGIIGGLLGYWLGFRYVTRRSIISENRIPKLTILFLIIPVFLILFSVPTAFQRQTIIESGELKNSPLASFTNGGTFTDIGGQVVSWITLGTVNYWSLKKKAISMSKSNEI